MENQTMMPERGAHSSSGVSSGFPTDLVGQSANRLRTLALLYALVFFLAGIFPALLFPEDRARLFGNPILWVPAVLGIGLGLFVAVAIGSKRLQLRTTMILGLVFEVASSYVIAAAEFGDPMQIEMH